MNDLAQKPFQLILTIVFGMLALLGLYVFATFSGFGGSGSKIGTVVIWGTLPAAVINQEISTLTTSDKSYAKVTYVQQQAANFDDILANAIASGSGPDMILISQEQLLSEESKIRIIPFSTIPQRNFLSDYLPEFQLYLTSTGTYGVPYALDPMVLYYNTSLLSQAGISQPPTSWEAVTGLAPTLTHLNPDKSQSAVPFGSYNNTENSRGILSLLFLQSGSTISTATQVGIRSTIAQAPQQGAAPVLSALNFYTQFSDSARTVYSWNASISSARQAFIGGILEFYPGFASEEPMLKAANPNLAFDMAAIPQPQTSAHRTDYGLAYAFAIPKASPNASGAYLVATALTGKNVLPVAAQTLSMAPAQNTLLVVSPSDLYAPVYYPAALISAGWLSPAPSTVDNIFSAMISDITSGRYQASDALIKTDQALNAALPST
jgi:multiple sugar transport system substrate-binding protein